YIVYLWSNIKTIIMSLDHNEVNLLCQLSAFIGKNYDTVMIDSRRFYWGEEFFVDFKKKEFCFIFDESMNNSIVDNDILYYAILGVCNQNDLEYGEIFN